MLARWLLGCGVYRTSELESLSLAPSNVPIVGPYETIGAPNRIVLCEDAVQVDFRQADGPPTFDTIDVPAALEQLAGPGDAVVQVVAQRRVERVFRTTYGGTALLESSRVCFELSGIPVRLMATNTVAAPPEAGGPVVPCRPANECGAVCSEAACGDTCVPHDYVCARPAGRACRVIDLCAQ